MTDQFFTPIEVANGTYSGLWSGHDLTWEYDGKKVQVHTDRGVRGLNIPVTFDVVDNRVDEESIKTVPC